METSGLVDVRSLVQGELEALEDVLARDEPSEALAKLRILIELASGMDAERLYEACHGMLA